MDRCVKCNSESIKKLGMKFIGKEQGLGYLCLDCGEKMIVPKDKSHTEVSTKGEKKKEVSFVVGKDRLDFIDSKKKIVLTCAISNSKVNLEFFLALKHYCKVNDAELVVLPIRYLNPSMLQQSDTVWYDDLLVPHLVENNFELWRTFALQNPTEALIRVLGNIKVQATNEHPLSGVDGLSQGATVIIPHPQVALKTLPRQRSQKYPAIAVTTGAVTEKNYSETKSGFKAGFNHSFSAVVIEQGEANSFIRHLNFDGSGFYDLDYYYWTDSSVRVQEPKALVTGDSHVIFHDEEVLNATFGSVDSICKVLRPEVIVRHDILDLFSRSHHTKSDHFLNYAKHHGDLAQAQINNVQVELNQVIDFLNKTTPRDSENIIVFSNHHSHLKRWLQETNPKEDPENAAFYHWMSYQVLSNTKAEGTEIVIPDPFKLYCEGRLNVPTKFLGESESCMIENIEVGMHGHLGVNGSKGGPKVFSNAPMKSVVGHTHSPQIDKGVFCVGTSSRFDLPYVKGLSSWDHAHCIIHNNGKRQMIFIRNGKWRA